MEESKEYLEGYNACVFQDAHKTPSIPIPYKRGTEEYKAWQKGYTKAYVKERRLTEETKK